MPRPYGEKFLLWLYQQEGGTLEMRLAKTCVEANLPMSYVAAAIGVSKISIFKWFRGRKINSSNQRMVEVFLDLVQKDTEAGVLPAQSIRHAKHYIETMIGREL